VILEIRAGPLTGKQFPVPEGEPLMVGRTERANVVVSGDSQISGVHFAVEWDGKVCRVIDRRSTNGTLLNGNRVTESTLRDGDVITAGDTRFIVRFVPEAKRPTQQPADASQPAPPSPGAAASSPPSMTPPSASGAAIAGAMAGSAAAVTAGAAAAMHAPAVPAGGGKALLGLPALPIALGVKVPEIPPMPALPGIPAVPGLAMSSVPGMPALPGVPGVALPAMPAVPGIPNVALPSVAMPQVPAIPSLPAVAIPQVPRPVVPVLSAAQLAAVAAEAARRALKALWQPSLVVGGWKFMMIPKGWVIPEERIGINCAHLGVFPAHILAGEEPLGAAGALGQLRDFHIKMFRDSLPAPRITEQKAPEIPGAEKVLAMDVVYKHDSGAGVLLRRLYAQNGQVAGTLTLMTLMADFAKLVPDLQVIQSGLRFEPQQPAPSARIPGSVGAPA
jgi:hypothetical protein